MNESVSQSITKGSYRDASKSRNKQNELSSLDTPFTKIIDHLSICLPCLPLDNSSGSDV